LLPENVQAGQPSELTLSVAVCKRPSTDNNTAIQRKPSKWAQMIATTTTSDGVDQPSNWMVGIVLSCKYLILSGLQEFCKDLR
jgi:hypothetical protein